MSMNNAINRYILHEISELRSQERRLDAALTAASSDSASGPFAHALARLNARMEELEHVLDQLDAITVVEPSAA